MVRTSPSQGGNPGSTPGRVTKCVKQANCLACEHFVKPEYVATERSNNEAGSRALSRFDLP